MDLGQRIAQWDAEAEAYDEPADHGLTHRSVRDAWRALLLEVLPPELRMLDDPRLWGSPTGDERYLVSATAPTR